MLQAFDQLTGVPCLLNTSFNIKGEPIVCTPHDALRTFAATGLDALAMGSYLLVKPEALSTSGGKARGDERKHILFVGAHHDDLELAIGGSVKRWVEEGVALAAARDLPRVLLTRVSWHSAAASFQSRYFVDITKQFEAKRAALQCYRNEYERVGQKWERLVHAQAMLHGLQAGCVLAEGFDIVKFLHR